MTKESKRFWLNRGCIHSAHLDITRQLIELKYNVRITSIEFEDGSGTSFNITTTGWEPKQHVRL
jgi:hypothetical protein